MSVRSLALGLVAAAPLAAAAPAPHWGWFNQDYAKTVTVSAVSTVYACPSTSSHASSVSASVSASASASKTSSASGSSSTAGSSVGVSATSAVSSSASSSAAATTTGTSTPDTLPSVTLTATASGSTGMNDAAKAAGKLYMGSAIDYPGTGEGADPYYLAEAENQRDFGAWTPANIMKWEFVEPEQGVFNFTGGDEFVALAKANNQLIRCHNLNWYNQNPTWLTNPTTPWNATGLLAVLENHITQTIAHFGDNCYAWDVVNEAFNDDGTYREDIWYNTTGTDYLYTAFRTAEAAVKANNLTTKLYYNDYNIEYPGNKSTSAQNLVKSIQAAGIQIDGVGLQSHFIVGETPSAATQIENMNAFTSLGVDVAVTELDIRTATPATLAAQQQQVLDYASTVAACHNVTRCVGVTVWDFDDTYSWVPGTFPGMGWADLFFQPNGSDTPLVKKAAYDGVLYGWQGVVPALGTQ